LATLNQIAAPVHIGQHDMVVYSVAPWKFDIFKLLSWSKAAVSACKEAVISRQSNGHSSL
jgi:predicted P-loop ATPase/GTPase